jgi:hypothetical protein
MKFCLSFLPISAMMKPVDEKVVCCFYCDYKTSIRVFEATVGNHGGDIVG